MSAPFKPLTRPVRLRGSTGRNPSLKAHPDHAEPVSVDTRLFVWQRDGGKCRNCGSQQDLHFDHVIPRSWGGSSGVENVQLLCRQCNLRKGASLVDGGGRPASSR